MTRIELRSRVGANGVLSVQVPVGLADANREVVITVQPAGEGARSSTDSGPPEWHEFVAETYGSCANLGLEEPDDLPLQERDWPQ